MLWRRVSLEADERCARRGLPARKRMGNTMVVVRRDLWWSARFLGLGRQALLTPTVMVRKIPDLLRVSAFASSPVSYIIPICFDRPRNNRNSTRGNVCYVCMR